MAITVNRKPVERDFVLEELDPTGETKVTIRQATHGDVIRRADLFSRSTQVVSLKDEDNNTLKYEQQFNTYRQQQYEIFLTMTGATGIVDEDGKPLFKTRSNKDGSSRLDMSETEFNNTIALLDTKLFEAIHNCVLEVNEMWNPKKKGE